MSFVDDFEDSIRDRVIVRRKEWEEKALIQRNKFNALAQAAGAPHIKYGATMETTEEQSLSICEEVWKPDKQMDTSGNVIEGWVADVDVIKRLAERGRLDKIDGKIVIPNPAKPQTWPFDYLTAENFVYHGAVDGKHYEGSCKTVETWNRDEVVNGLCVFMTLYKLPDKIEYKYFVKVNTHDSWSGPSTDIERFETLKEAEARVKEINGKNTEAQVPECYYTADAPQEIL